MTWWIQGVFFQWVERIGGAPGRPIGVPAEPHARGAREAQFMFFGSLWVEPATRKLVGSLQDTFGVSDIFDVEMTDEVVRFTKCYQQHQSKSYYLYYEFKQRDGVSWIGTWKGLLSAHGVARIILTEVPDNFFVPGSIHNALAPRPLPAHHDDCCSCDDHD